MSETKRPIGYTITYYWCRDCAPEGIREGHDPLLEGDDYGYPWRCDECGKELLPCDHTFAKLDGGWRRAFSSDGERQDVRFCDNCDHAEYRPVESEMPA